MSRKTIVVIMNCQGHEVIRYLRSSPSLSCQFDFVYISNIVLKDDAEAKRQALAALATAHVVISQNVSSVEWLQNDFIAQNIPRHCRFFRLCFWRFYGYWPVSAQKFHPQMWYVADEIPGAANFQDYIRSEVPRAEIARIFDEQIEKFAYIERDSEIKMLPFFLENYRTHKLFTDEWHPTSFFFLPIVRHILSELGFPDDVALLPNDGSDNFRHRFVYDCVTDELGLTYDQNLLRYYHVETDRETLYEYCKYAEKCYDRTVTWMDPDGSFLEWCFIRGIDKADHEIARFGKIVDQPRAAQRGEGLISRLASGAIFQRAAPAPEGAWSIDLREFRQITAIDIRLDGTEIEQDILIVAAASIDGADWTELTPIRNVVAVGPAGSPLTLTFPNPVLARHVRLEFRKPGRLRLDGVRIYARVTSVNEPG